MGGLPCIRGMRVTVSAVVGPLADGRSIDEVLDDYPYLERADVLAALAYAAAAVGERELPPRRRLPRRAGSGDTAGPLRSFYAWHLTFEGQPDLHALADRYQRALAGRPGLDLVPHRWLHLTVQGVGFTDEVPATNALAVTDAARRRLARLGPVRLTFHRPAVFTESVVLRPAPAEPVTQIRQQIRAAVGEVWGPDR